MLRSLYSGISGMKVNQVKLDVIANNIANVGTTAFKSSRIRFQDMVSQSLSPSLAAGTNQGGVNTRQVGQGVKVAGIDTIVSQGMMQPTSRNLDVGMDGEGYLMVGRGSLPTTNADGVDLNADNTLGDVGGMNISYTRDGALVKDNDGNLLNSDGFRVLGYAVNDGTNNSINYTNGVATLNYVDADSKTNTTQSQLVPLVIPDKIIVHTAATPITKIEIVSSGGTTTTTMTNMDDGSNISTTSVVDGAPDATSNVTIPAAGAKITTSRIISFSIEKDGVIKAVLEDGSLAALGQIAVASFNNPAGLEKSGGNLYQITSSSGGAVVRSGTGTDPALDNGDAYGDMLSGMLEMSNVDLAEQFTDMIVAQRAFQASGKSITTGDEILQEIINLKR